MPRLRSLKAGDYHCFLYENESEANAFAFSFIRQGLEKREKILYFAPDHSGAEGLTEVLRQAGIDIDGVVTTGQLQIEGSEKDSSEKMAQDVALFGINNAAPEPEATSSPGYSSLRIAIDDTGRLCDIGPAGFCTPVAVDRLEAIVGEGCLLVFMYDLRELSPETLFMVLTAYPSLILGDEVYENVLFRDTAVCDGEGTRTLGAEQLLNLLRDHRKLEETIRKGGEALRASEDNYRSIFESAANLIATVDKKGTIIDCNGKIQEVLGYEKEEVIGRSIAALFHPDHFHRAYETLKEVIKKGSSYNKQYQMVRKDGSTVYVSVNTTPLKNAKGKIAKVVSVVEDITERKRVEEALFESQKRYRHLVEILPDAVLTLTEGRIIFANSAAYKLFGLSHPRDLIGRHMADFFDGAGAMGIKRSFETIRQKAKMDKPVRVGIIRPDGTAVSIEWTGTLLDQSDTNVALFMGRDITERELAENLLRESEERYRIAIEHSNDGVAILGGEIYLYVNRRLAEIFGYGSVDEVVNKNIITTIHPDDQERVLAINHMRQRGECAPDRYEFKGMRKDGTIVHIEVSATPVVYKGQPGSLVYLRDITVRKDMENKLGKVTTVTP